MKILITTGPTWEFIDPVRIITSPATGTIGFLLAKEFLKNRENEVTIVCGPIMPMNLPLKISPKLKVKNVVSAQEMFKIVRRIFRNFDVIIMAASVSDFKPKRKYAQKIKKKNKKEIVIKLVQNPDILSFISTNKNKNQILVGFSLESHHLLKNTIKKFMYKKVDLIVANRLPAFGNNKISGYFVYNGRIERFKKYTKIALAQKIKSIVYKLKMILRLNV